MYMQRYVNVNPIDLFCGLVFIMTGDIQSMPWYIRYTPLISWYCIIVDLFSYDGNVLIEFKYHQS